MGFLDSIGSTFMNAISWVINLLPDSPFQLVDNTDVSTFLGTLNWFLPLSQIVAILELWLVAITTYYLYMVILRWVKAIG